MNRILAALSAAEGGALRRICTRRFYRRGVAVIAAGETAQYAYFPDGAVFSLRAHRRGRSIEVALAGEETCVGAFVALGSAAAPFGAAIAYDGDAECADAEALVDLLDDLPVLRRALLAQSRMQLEIFADAAALHAECGVCDRLAALLSRRFARTGADALHVTHAELSDLLGVHRPSVTLALQSLEARKAIRAQRGCIRLLDPDALLV